MDTIFSSVNQTGILTYLRIYMIPVLLILAATALVCVSRWRIFKMLGLPGWKGIVPIYSDYTLFKNRWKLKPFWFLTICTVVYYSVSFLLSHLMMKQLSGGAFYGTMEELKALIIPYIVISGLIAIVYLVISFAITIGLNIRVMEHFGEGVGFAVGMTIVPFVFYPLLAFTKKQATRKKRPLQIVSTVLTLALVFSIITCAPVSASAAETDSAAVAAADTENPFGELSEGKYTLESMTYQLTADVTLDGYIYISSGVSAVIDLSGHTVNGGAASMRDFIRNYGTLTITDSSGDDSGKLTGGYAERGGVVYNAGTLTIEGGTFADNVARYEGGAVINNANATLTVNGGKFTNNTTEEYGGGAFVNFGTMTIAGGAVTGNRAAMDGGAVFNAENAALTITGGTITGNSAGLKAGGVFNSANGNLSMYNTPVVKDNANGSLWLGGSSRISVPNGRVFATGAAIDVTADNMPRTVTTGVVNDASQRKVFTFSSGAVKAKSDTYGEILPDISPNAYANNWAGLKASVNSASSGDVIALTADITNTGGEKSIHVSGKSITLDLQGHTINVNRFSESQGDDYHFMYAENDAVLTVLDTCGGGVIKNGNATNGGAFDTDDDSNATLNLYNITLKDNKATDGGAIRSRANLNLNGVIIENNQASDDGGAIMLYDGADSCTIKNSIIRNNTSSSEAGAIDQTANITTTIENTYFENNTSINGGGAIYQRSGTVNITGGAFLNNSTNDGGAVKALSGTAFSATDALFSGNNATEGSGGAVASYGTATLTNCTFTDNTATQRGGGLYSGNGAESVTLTNSVFKNNTANTGGGIYIYQGTTRVTDCTVTDNTANTVGGGLLANDTLYVGGKTVIFGNTGNKNVYLTENNNITYDGLTEGARLGITAETYDRFLVTELPSKADMDYFTLDNAESDDYELITSYTRYTLIGAPHYGMFVKKVNKVTVNSWDALQNAIDSTEYETVIKLGDNITASSSNDRIRIRDGKVIIIDLNGKTLDRHRTSSDKNGHVIEVHSGGRLTVRDTSAEKTGQITGGYAENGGGVNVNTGGYFKLESGSICHNNAKNGGGVYVGDDSAEFTMTGGSVSDNTATQDGGGIFADYTAMVTGGSITNNSAKYGGGYYFDDSRLTEELSGVTISGNTATEKGGGVYVWHGAVSLTENSVVSNNTAKNGGGVCVTDECTFSAENVTFEKNETTNNGGGLFNDGHLTLDSCTFTENKAEKNGGGVYNSDTAVITGCTFKKNKTVNGTGGAINQYNGSLLLDGGEITENMAAYRGSGVYVHDESDNEKFQIKGDLVINNNVSTDVFLDGSEVMVVADTLSADSRIGVTLNKVSGTFTKGFSDNHTGENPATYFTTNGGYSVIADKNGEAMIIESDWTLLKNEIEDADNNATVTLDRDWTAISEDKTIVIAEDKHITLDLNGHAIDGDKAMSTSIFEVWGTLTITDTSEEHNGVITGGNASYGGAIYVVAKGTVNLENGNISGNTASQNGGGVYNDGVFNLNGGNVSDNHAAFGAGIYNSSLASVNGGCLTGNTADQNGGGIWNNGTLYLEGGTVSGNNAVRQGGGVFVSGEDATISTLKEPVVKDNSAPIGNNILLDTGCVIILSGGMYPTAQLDVVTKDTTAPITSGYSSHNRPAVFTYNGMTGLMMEKSGELYLRPVSGDVTVDSWEALQTAVNDSTSGQVIVLTSDLTATSGNSRIDVNGKTVTIELNGHKIDRNRSSSSGSGQVFYVHDGASLTINDSAGTGIITGGNVDGDGGAILVASGSTCTINGGSVQDNKCSSDGGGISVQGTLVMNGGSVAFNTASDTAGGIYCTESGTIKLDNALITGNKAKNDDGGGLNIHLANSDSTIKNSVISNNTSGNNGGGLRLDAKGKTLKIESTEIKGNTANDDGGGIYISEGTVDVSGSRVNNNTADNGGAVYFENGAKLTADSTQFNYNIATKHGAGGINCRDEMTLTDCEVNYNECKQDGGGIYFDCEGKEITISNTSVDYNTASGVGGGIAVEDAQITFNNGSVSYNKATGNGAGVHLDGKGNQFTTFKTAIDHNKTSKGNGGGIYLQTGEAHIRGGSISDNFAKFDGGGIKITSNTRMYIEEAADSTGTKEPAVFHHNNCDQHGGAMYLEDDGTLHIFSCTVTDTISQLDSLYSDEDFYIQGKLVFSGNNGCDIFMKDEDDKIHLEGALESGCDIGVKLSWDTGSFTDGFKTFHSGEDPSAYFHAEPGYAVATDGDGEVRIRSTEWIYLQNQINDAASGGTIQLTQNYKADKADKTLEIPEGKSIILDLNGYVLDGDKVIGSIILVKGALTVMDSSESQAGVITGGSSAAICNTGTLTFNSGRISGNDGYNGGAVNNIGTMTMNGGEFSYNTAQNGGGIYNIGTLKLYGGTIKENSSVNAGGIFCVTNSKLYTHGAPSVKDNAAVSGKNILLNKGNAVTIDGTLSASAKLDVATKDYTHALTSGYHTHGSVQGVFTYNESNSITLVEKTDGELYFPYDLSEVDVWVSTWAELQSAVNADENQGKVIGLSNDLGASGQQRIVVENKDVTIELAGHKMDRALTSKEDQGNVFKVSGSSGKLTIKDTVETGVITGGYADGDGGGIYVTSGATLTVAGGSVQGNNASNDGGGIYVSNAELVMTGGSVSNNTAGDNGGGIYTTDSAVLSLENAEITYNTSKNAGGGLNIHLKENAALKGCLIAYNQTEDSNGGGLVMNASGKTLTLDKTTVKNNAADDAGGGIYIDAGTVEMKGGTVNGNTAEDGGGVYISSSDTFIMTQNAVVSNNVTTKQSGGGITCKGDLSITGAAVKNNHSAKHGGGIYYQHSGGELTLTNATVQANLADKDGGGIYLESGTVIMDGGSLAGNTSIDGGGIFVTGNTHFTAKNGAVISGNTVTEQDGGGIVNKGETTLENATVRDNKAKSNGGGIWTSDKLTVSGSAIENNTAKSEAGGGICHVDGKVYLKGQNLITANTAGSFGAGIYVDEEADSIYIQDKLTVTDNNGSNVYLDEEYLTLSGELDNDARVSVSIEADFGKFTKDYSRYHSNVSPSEFFVSDYLYEVYKDGDEAALRWVEEDENPFVSKNDQIKDSDKVTGRNWMSAVSGERRINEINLLRSHDAAMNDVKANVSSSFVRLISTPLALGFLISGIAVGVVTGGVGAVATLGIIGTVLTAITAVFQEFSAFQAKTQYRYIDEQMNMGVRIFDLRINNVNYDRMPTSDIDDNKNLWHCHGESDIAGTYYGCDHEGDVLSAQQTLDWAKEFLKKNPSEVLLLEYDAETFDNKNNEELVFKRLKQIYKQLSYEVNPSTGKPYLYMEDGIFGKDYTYWPKLKDVRGQILYRTADTQPGTGFGGYKWQMQGASPDYCRSIGSNNTISSSEERVNMVNSSMETHPSPYILKDAMVHRGINSGLYPNTTDDPYAPIRWVWFSKPWITKSPTELMDDVYYGTDDFEGILKEGGHYNQHGEFYGVFSGDALTEKECRIFWSSNFSDDFEYRTITVKSGLDGDNEVKTYKVLKGTAITIPNNIYEKPQQGSMYFQNWKAKTGSSGSWDPDYSLQSEEVLGSDNEHGSNREWLMNQSYLEPIDPDTQIPQNSVRNVQPGETITIMDDTEFTAVWGSDVKTPVTVVWTDGDDADGLRTDRLEITYKNAGLSEQNTAYVASGEQWSTMISGDTLIDSIQVNWSQINATEEAPKGSEQNGYRYEVTGEIGNGFTVTMIHDPQKTVTAAGTVTWDDNDNLKQVRPDSVTVNLLKNGEKIDSATVTAEDGWQYDFGAFPEYIKSEEDGKISYQRDIYSVIEEPFMYYSAAYNDFDITNVYVEPDIPDVDVEISWKDSYNSYGDRPKSVTLHLWDGDTEIDKKVVEVESDSAVTLSYFDVEQYELANLGKDIRYSVTQDPIEGYTTTYKEIDGRVAGIVNEYDYSNKYFKGHSLSLNGDIGVNFFVKLTPEELSKAKINFRWFNKEIELSGSNLEYNSEQQLYKASCPVAVAEMTYDVTATLYIDGAEVEKDKYSVVKYANVILTDRDFGDRYKASLKAKYGEAYDADGKYYQLFKLVVAMLEYGANAQIVFDRNTDDLANSGSSVFRDDITSDSIRSEADDMAKGLEEYGLEYQYSSVVFLSGTSLRHFYKVIDETKYNAIKSAIKFVDEEKGEEFAVEPIKRGDMVYFQKKDIPASKLDNQYVLNIGENTYRYSVLDGIKLLMNSKVDEKTVELCKAIYRYNDTANDFFED